MSNPKIWVLAALFSVQLLLGSIAMAAEEFSFSYIGQTNQPHFEYYSSEPAKILEKDVDGNLLKVKPMPVNNWEYGTASNYNNTGWRVGSYKDYYFVYEGRQTEERIFVEGYEEWIKAEYLSVQCNALRSIYYEVWPDGSVWWRQCGGDGIYSDTQNTCSPLQPANARILAKISLPNLCRQDASYSRFVEDPHWETVTIEKWDLYRKEGAGTGYRLMKEGWNFINGTGTDGYIVKDREIAAVLVENPFSFSAGEGKAESNSSAGGSALPLAAAAVGTVAAAGAAVYVGVRTPWYRILVPKGEKLRAQQAREHSYYRNSSTSSIGGFSGLGGGFSSSQASRTIDLHSASNIEQAMEREKLRKENPFILKQAGDKMIDFGEDIVNKGNGFKQWTDQQLDWNWAAKAWGYFNTAAFWISGGVIQGVGDSLNTLDDIGAGIAQVIKDPSLLSSLEAWKLVGNYFISNPFKVFDILPIGIGLKNIAGLTVKAAIGRKAVVSIGSVAEDIYVVNIQNKVTSTVNKVRMEVPDVKAKTPFIFVDQKAGEEVGKITYAETVILNDRIKELLRMPQGFSFGDHVKEIIFYTNNLKYLVKTYGLKFVEFVVRHEKAHEYSIKSDFFWNNWFGIESNEVRNWIMNKQIAGKVDLDELVADIFAAKNDKKFIDFAHQRIESVSDINKFKKNYDFYRFIENELRNEFERTKNYEFLTAAVAVKNKIKDLMKSGAAYPGVVVAVNNFNTSSFEKKQSISATPTPALDLSVLWSTDTPQKYINTNVTYVPGQEHGPWLSVANQGLWGKTASRIEVLSAMERFFVSDFYTTAEKWTGPSSREAVKDFTSVTTGYQIYDIPSKSNYPSARDSPRAPSNIYTTPTKSTYTSSSSGRASLNTTAAARSGYNSSVSGIRAGRNSIL